MSVADESLAELFEQYKDEVKETIGLLDNELVALEQEPSSSELIFSLFRHMHSLKGSSRMFNVDNIAGIAHNLEDLMSLIDHDNSILAKEPQIIELLFRGNDIFREIISNLEEDVSKTSLTVEHSGFIKEIKDRVDKINQKDGNLVGCTSKLVEEIEGLLPSMEELDTEALRKILMEVNTNLAKATLKDNKSSQVKFSYNNLDLTPLINTLDSLIEKFQKEQPVEEEQKQFFEAATSLYQHLIEVGTEDAMSLIAELGDGLSMISSKGLDIDPIVIEFFTVLIQDLKNKFQVELVVDKAKAPKKTSSPTSSISQSNVAKTIRVDESKIDQFLESVGKLITKSEILNHLQFSFRKANIDNALLSDLSSITRTIANDIVNLQRAIMGVRQVEIDNILKKFPRLVRDISHKINKVVELKTSGERVPIDKSLLDDVEQALVHIVRNAVDHGLEEPNERLRVGKDKKGHINISVIQEDISILITVADDGQGLDINKIKDKSVEKGLISPEQAKTMSDKEAEMLIFRSGVSTKSVATEISGRGVGMDVVLTNLKKWGGEVIINNRKGLGLSIALRIPITNTLLTKEAILLELGNNVFCLPLENISEIVTVDRTDIHSHKEQAVFRRRGMIISIVDLKGMLGLNCGEKYFEKGTFIVLKNKREERQAIAADKILGQQKIVIKDFELEIFKTLPYFSGLTLLGDGRVVLVLDPDKFLKLS